MSKKFKINIKCNQVVYYDQRIEVTLEQLNRLQNGSKLSVSEFADKESFIIIANSLDGLDVADTEKEFNDLEVEIIREVICPVFAKKPFLSEKFYESPEVLINLFDELLKLPKCTDEFDMYTGGGFLSWTVKIDECRDILSILIDDIEAYRIMSDEHYHPDPDPNILNLCLFQTEHTDFFGNDHEIYWDRDKDFFTTKGEYDAYNFGN